MRMYFEKDYVMRQITMAIRMISRIVRGQEDPETIWEEAHAEALDPLREQLQALLDQSRVNEAEDCLYQAMQPWEDAGTTLDAAVLPVGLWFYDTLNQWSDEALEQAGFSREEIREGVSELVRRTGLPLGDIL